MRSHITKMSSSIKKSPPSSPRPRYILPAEHTPHTRTLMAFPTALSLYPTQLSGARSEILDIATAISKFEPVTIFVHPDDSKALHKKLQERKQEKNTEEEMDMKSRSRINIDVKETALESLWLRDTGPVFVLYDEEEADRGRGGGGVKGVDFNFNYWGSKLPLGNDIGLSTRILQISNIERVETGIIAEGGGIETDGEGTLLICASSVVNENRNPGMSREVIEEELMGVLGVEKVVWLEGVKGEDITDCHVDALARFVRPRMVVLSRRHGHGERGNVWSKVYEDAKKVLERERDAKGRRFEVVEIEEPDLEVIEQEAEMIEEDEDDEGFSSVFSYVNYLLVNGGVIAPKFGDEKADRKCKEALQGLFPDREVVQIRINMLPRAGGGIHCATQHVPAGRASG